MTKLPPHLQKIVDNQDRNDKGYKVEEIDPFPEDEGYCGHCGHSMDEEDVC